jgi:D-glycero-alpha-D-manno-heptose 1-phosphate guanylyltransferase
MIREAIILAGGLGTRLRDAVPDLPKCMAPVRGRPFLDYVIDHLRKEGIQHFIFSLGFRHESITEHLEKNFNDLTFSLCVEDEPLGTGGAIKLACTMAKEENVLVTNGDTLFKINIERLDSFHRHEQAVCTLALKPMSNFDRYGVVETDKKNRIISFREKMHYESGLINGGAYLLNRRFFLSLDFPEKFSFEKDFLEKYHSSLKMSGLPQDAYFIDIGIPEDYKRAETELEQ